MGFFHKFPYTDFHELNLDWLLELGRKLELKAKDIIDVINKKLDDWLDDGTIADIINDEIFGELNDKVDALEDAEERSDVLRGKRCILIGNSYARGTGGTIGQGWPYYFQQVTGCTAHIIKQSGGDFVDLGNENADFPGMTYRGALTTWSGTHLTAAEKREVKHIVVGGGFNDANDTDITAVQIADEIAAFCSYCRATYPNAKITIIPLWSNANFSYAYKLAKLEAWANYAGRNGAASTNDSIFWFIGDNDYTYGDNIHLNDLGYRAAGTLIASIVLGGQGTRVPYVGEGCTLGSGVSPVGTGWRVTRDNQGQVSATMNVTLPSGDIDNTTLLGTVGPKFTPREALYFIGYDFTPGYADRHLCCVCITSAGEIYFRAVEGDYPEGGHELYIHMNYRIGID